MRLRSSGLAALLAVTVSVAVGAQTPTSTTVRVTDKAPAGDTPLLANPTVTSYPGGTPNFYVSPYAGVINYGTSSAQVVSLNCVDFFHHVTVPETWTAWMTNLGDAAANNALLSYTRYGNLGGASAYANTLELYKQAAWLTLQYDENAGAAASANKTRAIQSAIWTLFNPLTIAADAAGKPGYAWNDGAAPWFNGPNTTTEDSQWWVTQAQTAIAGGALTDADLKYFSIITDNTSPWAADSKQEFIVHATPEPGTVVLMLTGLAALFVVVRRRRASASETVTA